MYMQFDLNKLLLMCNLQHDNKISSVSAEEFNPNKWT